MKVFFHIALDEFAAETLGKFDQYSGEVRNPEEELHFFVWGGCRPPPAKPGFWSDIYPLWSFVLFSGDCALVPTGEGLTLDRGRLVRQVAELFDGELLVRRLGELFIKLPKIHLANTHFQPCVTISGSLADPTTSALVLGLVHGFSRLRNKGLFSTVISQQPVHAVLGTGVGTTRTSGREEYTRVLVAQGLRDLEDFLRSGPGALADRAFPIYLVGDRPIDQVESDRPTQVSLAALALFGIATSVLNDQLIRNHDAEVVNPFFFQVDSDQNIHAANRSYDPGLPFNVIGALAVFAPRLYASRVLAARFCADYLRLFCRQSSANSLADCARLGLSQVSERGVLGSINEWAAGYFWRVSRERLASSEQREPDGVGEENAWFKTSEIEFLLHSLVRNQPWERLLDWYDPDRLRSVPLEDWLGSLEELSEVVEKGLLVQRQQYLENIQRRLLLVFVETLDGAIDRIFAQGHLPPVFFRPHIFSQAFLGDVHLELNKALASHQKKALEKANARALEHERLNQKNAEAKQKLEKALTALPSPASVILRLIPLVFIGFGLVFFLPVEGGPWASDPFRAGGGLLAGAIASGILLWRKVWIVRSRILQAYRAWRDNYRRLLALQDEILREQALGRILSGLSDVLTWYYEDGSGEPPLPEGFQIHRETKASDRASESGEPLLGRGPALRDFAEHLSRAAQAFDNLSLRLEEQAFSSYLEFPLPDRAGMALLYREVFNDFSPEEVMSFWERVVKEPAALVGPVAIPFIPDSNGIGSVWRRTFLLPSSEALLTEKTRQASSALGFFEATERGFGKRLDDHLKLPFQLKQYLVRKGGRGFAETELYAKFNHLDAPSMDVAGGEEARVVLAAGVGDLIAAEGGWSNDYGCERLHVGLRVTGGLSAENVICYPNAINPITPLGKAWRYFLEHPEAIPALAPVEWTPVEEQP